MNTQQKDKTRAAAQKYLQKGQLDRALREYEKLLEDDATDVRTRLKVGDLHARLNNLNEATTAYNLVAEHYAAQGFHLKAIAIYKQVLNLDKNQLPIARKLGEAYVHLGLVSDAVTQYRTMCNIAEAQGAWDECISAAERLVLLDGTNVASRIKLAEMHARSGHIQDALASFRAAAKELERNNRHDEWAKVLEHCVQLAPTDAQSCQALATYYLNHDDPTRALSKLQIAFKVEPRDPTTLGLLAGVFEAMEQPVKALSAFRELAVQQRQLHDVRGLEKTLHDIVRLDAHDVDAHRLLDELASAHRAAQEATDLLGAGAFPTQLGDVDVVEDREDNVGGDTILNSEPWDPPVEAGVRAAEGMTAEADRDNEGTVELPVTVPVGPSAPATPLSTNAVHTTIGVGPGVDLTLPVAPEQMPLAHPPAEPGDFDGPITQPDLILSTLSDATARPVAEALSVAVNSLATDAKADEAALNAAFAHTFDEFQSHTDITPADPSNELTMHFDLGIAYKEMGMLAQAIEEFRHTEGSATHAVNAWTMIGLCYLELGDSGAALAAFRRGLAHEHVTPQQAAAIRYEVGVAYQRMGQPAHALKFYEKTRAMDANFRDVTTRVQQLQGMLDDATDQAPNELDALLDNTQVHTKLAPQGKRRTSFI